MAIEDLLIAYKLDKNTTIAQQVNINTIDPDMAANIGIDLADILIGELPKQNRFGITASELDPVGGADTDTHYKSILNGIQIHRNVAGVWTLLATIATGVTLPDGILVGLRASLTFPTVTIFPGAWAIANVKYTKAVNTELNINVADLNFSRYDLIYANTFGIIGYVAGVASATPAFPATPANSIIVDYVVVPSSSSGNLPYMFYAGAASAQSNVTGIPISGAFDADGNFSAAGFTLSATPVFTVYNVNGDQIPVGFNKTTKIISGGTPLETFTAKFI